MARELTWTELARVIEEHEAHHNHRALKALCVRYHPGATRIAVQAVQEYDDNDYTYICGPGNLTVWAGDKERHLPADEVDLLALLAASPALRAVFPEAHADPLGWLEDAYSSDVYDLELCGIERGLDVEVDLTRPPPRPTRVYVRDAADSKTATSRP